MTVSIKATVGLGQVRFSVNILSIVFSVLLLGVVFISCADYSDELEPLNQVDLSDGLIAPRYSFRTVGAELHLLFADQDSLALKLMIIPSTDIENLPQTYFLDRISYTPELGRVFGEHLYAINNDYQHVLYIDQESLDKSILKWINKPLSADTWNIDILPYSNRLIAVLEDSLDVFIERDNGLYLMSLQSGFVPVRILENFSSIGDIGVFPGGFTVYNTQANELILIKREAEAYTSKVLLSSGKVHYSNFSGDSLRILYYDNSDLMLYSESGGDKQLITPCQGTTSVFLFTEGEQQFYLFNETIGTNDQVDLHRISLIYPLHSRKPSKYGRKLLWSDSLPILSFKAIYGEKKLVVALNQGILRLLVFDIQELIN